MGQKAFVGTHPLRPVTGWSRENFSPPREKCVGYSLKILDIVQKIGPLSENSSPLVVSQAGYGLAPTTGNLRAYGPSSKSRTQFFQTL